MKQTESARTVPGVAGGSLHVLVTADTLSGVWDFSWSLASELVQTGQRVTLLAFGEPSVEQQEQVGQAGVRLVSTPLRLPWLWLQDHEEDLRATQSLAARLVQEIEPDVVQANQFAIAAANLDAPVVLTAHNEVLSWRRWVLHEADAADLPPEWAAHVNLVRSGLRNAGSVVAVSRFLADQLRELYQLRRPIHVIHNGWAAAGTPPPIHTRPRLTVLAGRAWDAAKNVCLAADVAHQWPRVGRVVLAGSQRHPESGATVELSPAVEPLGHVAHTRLDEYLRRARAYVSAARYDPFGLLPLQAALAGCPLLLGDIPSYRELWDGTALFFPPDDAQALRRQWERLLDDVALADDLSTRAYQRALTRYGPARMAQEYLALYQTSIAGFQSSPSRHGRTSAVART